MTMHQKQDSPLSILAECDNGYIGVCDCCLEYNFVYKNLLLAFSQDELVRFCEWLIQYRHHRETFLPLPHGRTRVYKSPLSNMFIAFHDEELDDVEQMFCQARLVIDARGIVQPQ
jgi:hypothetical protein